MPVEKRNPTALYCDDPSLTVQSLKDECDINQIIAKVNKGADLTHVEARVARYGDFSDVPSYQVALDLVSRANASFMELSPQVRERFMNDPGKMVAFIQDAKNYDEAVKLGLLVAKKVVEAPKAPEDPIPAEAGK